MLEQLPISEIAKIVIPGFIAFISGWYFSRREQRKSFAHESFHKVYDPALKLINPYKYKKVRNPNELLIVLRLIHDTINKNPHLVRNDLDLLVNEAITRIQNKSNFDFLLDIISLNIENNHRKLKRQLGYPTPWGVNYVLRNSSWRRFKARFRILDSILAQIFIVICTMILLILVSSIVYNTLVTILKWISNIELPKTQ